MLKTTQNRAEFWLPRANTAAIASHTNAFKINEDVVIPLKKLATYSDNIERINIELSISNKIIITKAIKLYLNKENNSKTIIANKLIDKVITNWQQQLSQLTDDKIFKKIQTTDVIISYKTSIKEPLFALYAGNNFTNIRENINKIHIKHLSKRLFIALHMHAGDGNVHTNIPVHSHSKSMLKQANLLVDKIIKLTNDLGGVISGEHGIGLTKYKYLNNKFKNDFIVYKKNIDPQNNFNKGKLMPGSDLTIAYTPSLELLEQEALILESSEIGSINELTKSCLRCGKCKSVCTTHVPEQNLLYSPRDKIIGSNLLIEAFLYEEQTRRGISLSHFIGLGDIADHCTICHLCVNPCPVDIDFGDVSIKMRKILQKNKQHKSSIIAKLSMAYLNTNNPTINNYAKKILNISYKLQRIAYKLFKPFIKKQADLTTNKPNLLLELTTLLDKPLPDDISLLPLRELLDIKDSNTIPVIYKKNINNMPTIFYFPGCGSEKLFSQISLATIAMLYHHNIRIVLPPNYLCCGYPQKANGNIELANSITTDNKVLFHRIANTLNYLDITHIITSCGTCIDQIATYNINKIFIDAKSIDIHQYLADNNITINSSEKYLYHAPCHDPIKNNSDEVISKIIGSTVVSSDRCCGESGTFAVNRSDIAKAVKAKKQQNITDVLQDLTHNNKDELKILTTCPSCRQGLSRYSDATGIKAIYPIEIMAKQILGDNWQQDFIDSVNIEKVLL